MPFISAGDLVAMVLANEHAKLRDVLTTRLKIRPGDLIEGVQTENLTWGNDARLDQLLSRQGIGEATPTAREVLRRAALIEEEEQDLGAMSSTRLLLALTSVGGAVQLVGKTTTTDDGRGVLALHRIFSSQDAIGTGFRAIASKFRTPFTKGLRRSVSITVNVKAILSDALKVAHDFGAPILALARMPL